MPVKAKFFQIAPLQLGLQAAHRKEAKKLGSDLVSYFGPIYRGYEMTFEKWKGRYDPARVKRKGQRYTPSGIEYPNVDAKLEYEVVVTKNGIRLIITSLVVDETGQPHFLWYMLDNGTKATTFTKDSVIFPIRVQNRTRVNSLSVSAEPKYGGFAQIKAGETREGITARNWSRQIGFQIKRGLSDKLGVDGWEIDYRISRPL